MIPKGHIPGCWGPSNYRLGLSARIYSVNDGIDPSFAPSHMYQLIPLQKCMVAALGEGSWLAKVDIGH